MALCKVLKEVLQEERVIIIETSFIRFNLLEVEHFIQLST